MPSWLRAAGAARHRLRALRRQRRGHALGLGAVRAMPRVLTGESDGDGRGQRRHRGNARSRGTTPRNDRNGSGQKRPEGCADERIICSSDEHIDMEVQHEPMEWKIKFEDQTGGISTCLVMCSSGWVINSVNQPCPFFLR